MVKLIRRIINCAQFLTSSSTTLEVQRRRFHYHGRGAGREGGFAATEFFTHSAPETSFRFWDPRHDEESRTADLPDIPASEHRRQNLDASRLRAREFRDRRSTAGRQTGIGVSRVLLMGGIKKWAAPWMCRGPI